MPDLMAMGQALLVSALVAAAVSLAIAWPKSAPQAMRVRVGCLLGLAAGIYAGCGMLGQWPRWPAPEDRDRFLAILLPLTIIVEGAAPLASGRRRLIWLLRACVVGSAAPILLFNSVYLVDLSGPNSAEWTAWEAAIMLTGLAALLAMLWGLLALLQRRDRGPAASLILALSCMAAGLTLMLSGYFKGGLLGLPLAGALAGAALASFVVAAPVSSSPVSSNPLLGSPILGVGAIGLFTVLVIGRFFGALPTATALCLLLTPLLAWLTQAPGVRKLRPGARAGLSVLLVAVVLSSIVSLAWQKFSRDFSARPAARAPASEEQPSPDP